MTAPKMVTAVCAFVAIDGTRYTVVQAGEVRLARDPLVKAHPKMFAPQSTGKKR
jgi:hypothetical protein